MSSTNGHSGPIDGADLTDFATQLRAAIRASGLGLDRIRARLRQRGIGVSVTALSYWQTGKRRPERARSLSAVQALEEILDIPSGSLVALLPPPRPRGSGHRTLPADAGRRCESDLAATP